MKLPDDVMSLLDRLLDGVQRALEGNLVGVYLRGSLATGDFVPQTSDVDVLAVTERPVGDEEFRALLEMHAALAALPHPFANRLEIAYIDREALRRFRPRLRHPTLGQGETLVWSEHHANWILERWSLREYGMPLAGPDPRGLIDPIGTDELCEAVRSRLPDWAEWAQDTNDPEWQLPRSHKAYVVETMCRALYTLANGRLASKRESVAWAVRALPEPWRTTAKRSQEWRTDRTVDLAIVPEVRQFVLWAASAPNIPRRHDADRWTAL